MFRNERRYLVEWVLHHYLLGVEHFYLYDNESEDKPEEVLRPYHGRRGDSYPMARPRATGEANTGLLQAQEQANQVDVHF